ncbi:hypothetical protein NKDENANG_02637 [Candidatus Entotheonellaceae bacterium PAL068K]
MQLYTRFLTASDLGDGLCVRAERPLPQIWVVGHEVRRTPSPLGCFAYEVAATVLALASWQAGMTSLPNFSMEPITLSWGIVSVCMIIIT